MKTLKLGKQERKFPRALTVLAVLGMSQLPLAAAFPPDAVVFHPSQRYAVGNYPMVGTVGDLNNDGAQDIVTANILSSDVSVLLGNGDGTFQAERRFGTGTWPWHLALADLNADGKLDLVVANRFNEYGYPSGHPGDLSVLLGNGDGSFQPETRLPAGVQPMGLALADLNHDGKIDLALLLHGENRIVIRLGNGDGAFQPAQYVAAGAGPMRVIAVDMNRDGKLDLVVANWWSYDISVLLGNGDGTFGVHNRFPIGERCNSHAVGDLNGDGFLDVAAGNSAPWDRTVSILLGNGDGTMQPQQRIAVASDPYGVALADLNTDGILDLVVTQPGLDHTLILLGLGDGSFQVMPPANAGSTTLARWVAVADLNGDTLPDLVLPHGPDVGAGDVFILLQVPKNHPPTCDAGQNIQIASTDQSITVVQGTAADADNDPLKYRWLEGATVLLDWTAVGPGGEAALALGSLPYFSIGNHTLTLQVKDAVVTVSDDMVLTAENSPPEACPAPSHQVIEIGVDPIVVIADVADFDGDTLTYQWLKDSVVLASGTVATPQGGDRVPIPDLYVLPGDSRFGVGVHQLELKVSDGVNAPVSAFVSVDVTDTMAPSLSPIPSVTILWPPNHKLQPMTIQANAYDNGGGAIHLTVEVTSSEPPDTTGDGQTIPDYYIDSVNDQTGVIELRLRSERSGKGPGRIYTVAITATDESGNQSVARVEISAPHDKRTK